VLSNCENCFRRTADEHAGYTTQRLAEGFLLRIRNYDKARTPILLCDVFMVKVTKETVAVPVGQRGETLRYKLMIL
jgi:hypothetical protein